MQYTIAEPSIVLEGPGLHTGKMCRLQFLPALPSRDGIVFERKDIQGPHSYVDAVYSNIDLSQSTNCTMLQHPEIENVNVRTIEHAMSALAAWRIGRAVVQVEGPEVPILDGSAKMFFNAIKQAGRKQHGMRQAIRITREVQVEATDPQGNAVFAKLSPLKPGQKPLLHADFAIDFAQLGEQRRQFVMDGPEAFRDELLDSRTFTTTSMIPVLHDAGMIKGGNEDIALIINDMGRMKPEQIDRLQRIFPNRQLRDAEGQLKRDTFFNKALHPDEPVRHKLMDLLGDLALAGHEIQGNVECERGGHRMTNLLLRKLFDPSLPKAYELVDEWAGIQMQPQPSRKGVMDPSGTGR